MSFTAGKNGLLTKILLYGKPNYAVSEHYGLSMNGFIPFRRSKFWTQIGLLEISRTEIVNQLVQQGLSESDAGWITMRIRGEVQESGKTYFWFAIKFLKIEHGLVLLHSGRVIHIQEADIGFTPDMI